MNPSLAATLTLAAALFGAAATSAVACPASDMVCNLGSPVDAWSDSTSSAWHSCADGESLAQGSYDLVDGALSSRSVMLDKGPISGFGVYTHDLYRVLGIPAGASVSFVARLKVRRTSVTTDDQDPTVAEYGAGISLPGDPGASREWLDKVSVTDASGVVSLPLVELAGEPFELRLYLYSQALFASAEASAELEFIDLPVGAYVESCQGFRSGPAVPAIDVSWGGVKAAYR